MGITASTFALFTAFFFASSFIVVRKGLIDSSPPPASLVSFAISTVYFWTLSLAFERAAHPDTTAVLLFALGGIFAPGFTRWLRLLSFEKIGVPLSGAVSGTAPLFVILWATLLLREEMTSSIISGTILVTAGIVALHGRMERTRILSPGIAYAIGSAFFIGVGAAVRKMGLLHMNAPLLAGAVGSTASLLVFTILFAASHARLPLNLRSLRFFAGSAFLEAFGLTTLFYGYSSGSVIVVESLVNTTPLIAIVLSVIFLRRIEHVTRSTILGAGVIVAGATLVVAG